jgi:hypothetical protein
MSQPVAAFLFDSFWAWVYNALRNQDIFAISHQRPDRDNWFEAPGKTGAQFGLTLLLQFPMVLSVTIESRSVTLLPKTQKETL